MLSVVRLCKTCKYVCVKQRITECMCVCETKRCYQRKETEKRERVSGYKLNPDLKPSNLDLSKSASSWLQFELRSNDFEPIFGLCWLRFGS